MKLQTKAGVALFSGLVLVQKEGFSVVKQDGGYLAVDAKGKTIGEIDPKATLVDDADNEVSLKDLVPAINGADLVGKDPNTLSKEELVVLTQYLQELAGGKVAKSDKAEKKSEKVEKKAEAKEPAGEEKTYTREELKAMGAKKLWKDVIQPIVDKLEGITSRSKMDEMIDAYLKFVGAEEEAPAPVKEEKKAGKKAKKEEQVVEEEDDEDDEEDEDEEESDEDEDDESDESDEDEDEDEEDDEDSEDDSDEDEDDDDEDDEDDEDDDEDEDVWTEEDIDELEDSKEIKLIIKKNGLKLPEDVKPTLKNIRAFLKKKLVGKAK